jgi:hypothetical protein
MGLFSRLLGASSRDDRSYLRTWAEKRMRELGRSGDLSVENLFAATMYSLSSFSEEDTSGRACGTKGSGFGHYSGDAALFELGCYMYFRLDLWLYKRKPHCRRDVSPTFATEFVKLFSQALTSRDIPSLFDQRVSQYGRLAQAGADLKQYHHHLSQLILRTRDNQLPRAYDFEGREPLMLNAMDDFLVKTALLAWEEHMLPASLDMLTKYCDMTEQQAHRAGVPPTALADKRPSESRTDEESAVDRPQKGLYDDRQHFRMAREYYQTAKYCDAVLHAKKSIALLRALPYDAEKFVLQRDDLVEMVRVCVRSLCKLGRAEEGLVECDRAIGYFSAFVESIQDLREHGSDLDEQELDKLEELAICQALGLSQFLSEMKKETGAELPPDYDPGFRIQRT